MNVYIAYSGNHMIGIYRNKKKAIEAIEIRGGGGEYFPSPVEIIKEENGNMRWEAANGQTISRLEVKELVN